MTFEKAQSIFEAIQETTSRQLLDDLVHSAIRYARVRTDWNLQSENERASSLLSRATAHNALIDSCNILSRAMNDAGEDNSWRGELGQDRKVIGDFGCYLHCILGLMAR